MAMAFSGVIRKVPGGAQWEIDLPPIITHPIFWSSDFTCCKIKGIFVLHITLISYEVKLQYDIIEVPDAAYVPQLVRWHVEVKGVDGLGQPCVMNGEKTVQRGYNKEVQLAFLKRAELVRLLSPGTCPTFSVRVEVEDVNADRQLSTVTEAHSGDKFRVSRHTQTKNECLAAVAKECCHADVKDKFRVSRHTQTKNECLAAVAKECCHADVKDLTLRKHLKDLLLFGEDHDVVVKIKDREFKAHRDMLRARSPVFAAMFRSGMKESTDGTITVDDCDPEAFGEFLEYVYSGEVQNISTVNAMGLYYAGDKYDFPGLKEACVEFLKTSLSTTTVSGVISLALKHGEHHLLESAMAFFVEHFEEIMVTVEWQSFVLANPIQVNEICLKTMKKRLSKD